MPKTGTFPAARGHVSLCATTKVTFVQLDLASGKTIQDPDWQEWRVE